MDEVGRETEKERAEAAILSVIEMIEGEGRQPDAWEKMCLVHALGDLFRGLYRLAQTDAVLARTPTGNRSPVPVRVDPAVEHLDLARLKAVLDEARLQPVRIPFFGQWSDSSSSP
jgi:hypothetical protein